MRYNALTLYPLILSIMPWSLASRELEFNPTDSYFSDNVNLPFSSATLDKLASDADAISKKCELEIFDDIDNQGPLALLSYLQQVAKPCSASEETEFLSAMQDFATCAGFDFLESMESFPSAVVGTFLECALDFVSSSDLLDNVMTGKIPAIPESCTNAEFGQNPFGNMMRQMALYPDKTLPCFSTLSASLPSCRYETWPIPMVGDWVKKVSCVLGASTELLEDYCEAGLTTLGQCMPTVIKESDCLDLVQSCVLVGPVLYGMPLPDTCVRVAKEKGLQKGVEQYKGFQNTCVTASTSTNFTTVPMVKSTNLMSVSSQGDQKSWSFAGPFIIGAAAGILVMVSLVFLRDRKKYSLVAEPNRESEMMSVSYRDSQII